MTRYYPVGLDLANKTCLVFGGGKVAERKTLGLLEVGAKVVIFAPVLSAKLRRWRDEARLTHITRGPEDADFAQAVLAIAATDDDVTNRAIADRCHRLGVFVNVVDNANNCDFILPSVFRRGDLTITVSTNGRSPAVARWVRELLEKTVTAEHQVLLDLVAEERAKLRAKGQTVVPELWHRAFDDELLTLLRQDDVEAARTRLRVLLKSGDVDGQCEGD